MIGIAMKLNFRRLGLGVAAVALGAALMPLVAATPNPGALTAVPEAEPDAALAPGPAAAAWTALAVGMGEAAFGASGALRTQIVHPGQGVPLHLAWPEPGDRHVQYSWRPVFGTPGVAVTGTLQPGGRAVAPEVPGVYELEIRDRAAAHRFGATLRLVVRVPFERKRAGYIGPYRLGTWPTEGKGRGEAYRPPAGFIEVTEANQSLPLSQHFTLGQFLTKDQESVWPKYVAVNPRLIDKLELVILELRAMGVRADRMVVMSGFRTPHYNHHHLGNPASSLSRHQFGDAADVWVDNEDDWYMSDLNGDGRRDIDDARVILRAVERVERRHPELAGGAGLYRANRVRGPFIHIDVRGTRARW
jgi:hypothetical protein